VRIVIVEDEVKARKGIINLIRKFSDAYQIIGESDNGVQGAALIEELQPDLVITDIQMPGMDGIEMLEALKARGVNINSIVLSGHSDFQFAQRALRTGLVSAYLLKPITVDELYHVLQTMEKEYLIRLLKGKEEFTSSATPELMIQRYLVSQGVNEELFELHMNRNLGFTSASDIELLSIYFDQGYTTKCVNIVKRHLLREFQIHRIYVIELPESKEIIVLLQKQDNQSLRKQWDSLVYDMRSASIPGAITAWTSLPYFGNLKNEVERLRELYPWSMLQSSEYPLLVRSACVAKEETQPQYPIQLEMKSKELLSSGDKEKLNGCVDEFLQLCLKQAVQPEQIIQWMTRFVFHMVTIVEALSGNAALADERNRFHAQIKTAYTLREVRGILHSTMAAISPYFQQKSRMHSMNVTKAVNLIHERYQTGITLEELAGYCHVTPEYLSSLFQKELGMSFTAYVKDIRIKKAKELLLTNALKLFEVAERVGYPDAKYFSRVFKETTGMTPREFQNLHN
jgi:two-component system, response regulator YesN